MTNYSIKSVKADLFRVPLPRPWAADVSGNFLITCQITDSEGEVGTGFSWTPQIGGHAIHAMVEHDCAAFLAGRAADPEAVWDLLWRYLHEAGGGGITTLAIAAVDTALWDIRLRREKTTLAKRIGSLRSRLSTYGSGINYDYDLSQLKSQAERWVAAGHDGVKIKVGHPSLDDDMRRCELVRSVIGDRRRLMIDANQRWSLDEAARAINSLARFDIHWMEEPLRADDIEGHRELRNRVDVPLALGENQRTIYEFRRIITSRAADIIQPNAVRVGGITPFLRIAHLGNTFGVRVCPHHLPELSAQLACRLPKEELIEEIEDSSFTRLGILKSSTVAFDAATVRIDDEPNGLGISFDFERLAPLKCTN